MPKRLPWFVMVGKFLPTAAGKIGLILVYNSKGTFSTTMPVQTAGWQWNVARLAL
jgi:hypothetical protein